MNCKQLGICCALLVCVSLSGCAGLSSLSTQWSDNFALPTYGTKATHPYLNDGKLDTVAVASESRNKNRVFMLKFSDVKKVRRIIIHNENLFRFKVDYWDGEDLEWKTVHSVRQRRNIENKNAQPEYVLDRLNFQTHMIRVNVSRTFDDYIAATPIREPGDKVVNQRMTLGGFYLPHYRVLKPALAKVREIEVYHLAEEG